MSSENEEQDVMPPELENMMMTFAMHAVAESPQDLTSFAADYFARLRDRQTSNQEKKNGSEEDISAILGRNKLARRSSVMGERYDPEKDEEGDDEKDEIYPKTDEERERIKEKSNDVFLFRVLDDVDLSAVIDAMKPTPVPKDESVIKQGEDGDYFYLIDRGHFDVFITDNSGEEEYKFTYKDEGFFGELALLYNQPRAATITAATEGFLWALSRRTFKKLIVKRAFEKRQMFMKLLGGVPQLKSLTEYERMQVADALQGKAFDDGAVIIEEGDAADGMYFIVEGEVSIKKASKDGYEEIGQLKQGEFFGELALVEHQPRAATVTALKDTRVAFLEVKAFERLLGPCMDILKRHTETYKKQK